MKFHIERARRWVVVSVYPPGGHYGAYGGPWIEDPLRVYFSKPMTKNEARNYARRYNAPTRTRKSDGTHFPVRLS